MVEEACSSAAKSCLRAFSVVELCMKRIAANETRLGGLVESPVERIALLALTKQLSRLLQLRHESAGESTIAHRLGCQHAHPFHLNPLGSVIAIGQDRRDGHALRSKAPYGGRSEHVDEVHTHAPKLLLFGRIDENRPWRQSLFEKLVVNQRVAILFVDIEIDELEALVDQRS